MFVILCIYMYVYVHPKAFSRFLYGSLYAHTLREAEQRLRVRKGF